MKYTGEPKAKLFWILHSNAKYCSPAGKKILINRQVQLSYTFLNQYLFWAGW